MDSCKEGEHCWDSMGYTRDDHHRCCYCTKPNPHLNQGNSEDDMDQS